MIAVNYSTLRNNMKAYFDKVSEDQDTLVVTRKNDNIVVMSQEAYDSMKETLYLTGNRENYDHLMKSIGELKSGKIAQHELTED